jgi:ketosteroid isomerase-like protein
MLETEQFLTAMTERITAAEVALHNGDARQRIAMWSRTEPLTLFGAAMNGRGWGQIRPIFELLGTQFCDCESYRNEIIAAEARGDLAYTVALEHTTASINGAEPRPYVLRATTIFRREDGEWKVVHRHGDPLSADIGADPAALTPLAGKRAPETATP